MIDVVDTSMKHSQVEKLHWLMARAIGDACTGNIADARTIKSMLFDGVDEETFMALVRKGREIVG